MSFAAQTKSELCRIANLSPCCRKAECYGLLLFAKNFSRQAVSMTTEHPEVARRVAELTAETAHVFVDVATRITHRKTNVNTSQVAVMGEDQRIRLLEFFGHMGQEISLHFNYANLESPCCVSSFLRGVFLSCGSVTNPEREYHLEFVVPFMNLAKDLMLLLSQIEDVNLQPAMINRKGAFVVYLKGSECIADLLTFLGAPQSSMELMQVKMLKEVRNNVNRKMNFETANLDKTAAAAARQLIAIEEIMDHMGLEQLPEDLQEIAQLRYENPEMSLRELGESLSVPLTRSGVNHRLRRLVELADGIAPIKDSFDFQ